MDLVFEWDPQKAKRNFRKHGITFDEATTVSVDPSAEVEAPSDSQVPVAEPVTESTESTESTGSTESKGEQA